MTGPDQVSPGASGLIATSAALVPGTAARTKARAVTMAKDRMSVDIRRMEGLPGAMSEQWVRHHRAGTGPVSTKSCL